MKYHIEFAGIRKVQLDWLVENACETAPVVIRRAIEEMYLKNHFETYEEQQAREAAEIKAIFKARGFPDNWDSLPLDEKDVIRKEIELRERAE